MTGRPRTDAERYIRDFASEVDFGAAVCREDAPLKPDPAPARRALESIGARSAWMPYGACVSRANVIAY